MSEVNENLVAGLWSGHDCSYCILDKGSPVIHAEYERYIREKEPPGDSFAILKKDFDKHDTIKYFATCHQANNITEQDSYKELQEVIEKNGGSLHVVSHHLSHASNAFFSSNFDKSIIITIDGGGNTTESTGTGTGIYLGQGNKVEKLFVFDEHDINIGKIWTRATRYIFKMHTGHPLGHKAGTVMALGAMGKPLYENEFYQIITDSALSARARRYCPGDQKRGIFDPEKDNEHPIWNKWRVLAAQSEEEKFNIATSLQAATERVVKELIDKAISLANDDSITNLCLSGGVSLNSVCTGKIYDWYEGRINNIYVPPAPNDAGLSIGAAQYVWHHVLENKRVLWQDNFTPYLGKKYTNQQIIDTLEKYKSENFYKLEANDSDVAVLLDKGSIVSVFGGGSESGKRALGNRSILADPRSPTMKDVINEKVKHREWYRPFAPSILREEVKDWFERDISSPYMSFVLKFKESQAKKVPAVTHFDRSARLQTVTENDNAWYYNFLKCWQKQSGVPILLNTSFNDREPICETPEHAIRCFLKTDIDCLYFYDAGIILRKQDNESK